MVQWQGLFPARRNGLPQATCPYLNAQCLPGIDCILGQRVPVYALSGKITSANFRNCLVTLVHRPELIGSVTGFVLEHPAEMLRIFESKFIGYLAYRFCTVENPFFGQVDQLELDMFLR